MSKKTDAEAKVKKAQEDLAAAEQELRQAAEEEVIAASAVATLASRSVTVQAIRLAGSIEANNSSAVRLLAGQDWGVGVAEESDGAWGVTLTHLTRPTLRLCVGDWLVRTAAGDLRAISDSGLRLWFVV